MKESAKEKYEKKIGELEKRVRKLEKERVEDKKEGTEETVETSAGEILKSVGTMFGIGGLIKSVEKLPEFQERVRKIDEELKRKLQATPLKRAGERTSCRERGLRQRTVKSMPGRRKKTPVPREREVDIFDEDAYLLIIIEIPGADEKTIKLSLEKDKLTLFADRAGKKYHKEIVLPCIPKGKITQKYKNGILEIKIIKSEK